MLNANINLSIPFYILLLYIDIVDWYYPHGVKARGRCINKILMDIFITECHRWLQRPELSLMAPILVLPHSFSSSLIHFNNFFLIPHKHCFHLPAYHRHADGEFVEDSL